MLIFDVDDNDVGDDDDDDDDVDGDSGEGNAELGRQHNTSNLTSALDCAQ